MGVPKGAPVLVSASRRVGHCRAAARHVGLRRQSVDHEGRVRKCDAKTRRPQRRDMFSPVSRRRREPSRLVATSWLDQQGSAPRPLRFCVASASCGRARATHGRNSARRSLTLRWPTRRGGLGEARFAGRRSAAERGRPADVLAEAMRSECNDGCDPGASMGVAGGVCKAGCDSTADCGSPLRSRLSRRVIRSAYQRRIRG